MRARPDLVFTEAQQCHCASGCMFFGWLQTQKLADIPSCWLGLKKKRKLCYCPGWFQDRHPKSALWEACAPKEPPVLSSRFCSHHKHIPFICQTPHLPLFRRSTRACLTETVSSNELTQKESEPKMCLNIFKCFTLFAFIYVYLPPRILFFPFIALLTLIHPPNPSSSLLFWKAFPNTLFYTLWHFSPPYAFLLLLTTLYYNLDGRDQVFLNFVSPVSSEQ